MLYYPEYLFSAGYVFVSGETIGIKFAVKPPYRIRQKISSLGYRWKPDEHKTWQAKITKEILERTKKVLPVDPYRTKIREEFLAAQARKARLEEERQYRYKAAWECCGETAWEGE